MIRTPKIVGLLIAGVMLATLFASPTAHAITLSELVELFIALEIISEDKADAARAVLVEQEPADQQQTVLETPPPPVAELAEPTLDLTRSLSLEESAEMRSRLYRHI